VPRRPRPPPRTSLSPPLYPRPWCTAARGHIPLPPHWPIKGTPSSPENSHPHQKPPRHRLDHSIFLYQVHRLCALRQMPPWPPLSPGDSGRLPNSGLKEVGEDSLRHLLDIFPAISASPVSLPDHPPPSLPLSPPSPSIRRRRPPAVGSNFNRTAGRASYPFAR
jgi:hypothetical protein